MSALDAISTRLRETVSNPPGVAALEAAAHRAVEATNQQLVAARVPARAEMVRHGTGFRLTLVQTGRLDRKFAGRTPRALLRENVRKEMQLARVQIAEAARKALRP